MLTHEIIQKLQQKQELTLEEVDFVIDFIAKTVIRNLKNNFQDYETKCDYSTQYLLELSCRMNYKYCGYETGKLLMPELKHHFGFVGLRTENGPIWYLIDLTYKQFENKNYPITINGIRTTIEGPANKISPENKEILLQKGYIKLTDKNLIDYIDSFIKSYPKNVDSNEIYRILYEEMDSDKISIYSDDQFSGDDGAKGIKL